MEQTIRIGTRKSELALRQTELAAQALQGVMPGISVRLRSRETKGDRILNRPLQEFGGKGVFVTELEEEILKGELDLAVHSAKDLPARLMEGLSIAGVLKREDPRDVLVTAAGREMEGSGPVRVGTSSPRRRLQTVLLGEKLWPGRGAACENLRGNVQTRLKRLEEGAFDAIILAAAGLKRLGLLEDARFSFQFLDPREFIPAGGQGILALEAKAGSFGAELSRMAEDAGTRLCFQTERRVLELLDAGCHEPVGVYCRQEEGRLRLLGIREREGRVYRVCLEEEESRWHELAEQGAKGLGGR